MGLLRARAPARPTQREELGGASDATLVARAQLGDRPAFAELYRRHVGAIYDFCAHRLSGREAAEDATQAVFMRAIGALPECKHPDAVRAWLFGIARHVVLDAYRANRRGAGAVSLDLAPNPAADLEDRSPSPERLALAAEEHGRVRRARAHLTPDERELLDLLQQELTDKEIAEILGRRHGAIRTAHWRLRRKLRALLGDAGPDAGPGKEARRVER
jgi:RNA polymerase sigma-70 factor (ECF subfamily)